MPTDMRRFQALTATGSVEIGVVPRFERMDNAMPADMRKMPAANTAILSIQPRCDIAVGAFPLGGVILASPVGHLTSGRTSGTFWQAS